MNQEDLQALITGFGQQIGQQIAAAVTAAGASAAAGQAGVSSADLQQIGDTIGDALKGAGATGKSSHRVSRLSTCEGPDWVRWKSNFVLAMKINNWSLDRAKMELRANMEGRALDLVSNVDLSIGTDSVTIEDVIKRFDEKFWPPSKSAQAENAFNARSQGRNESVEDFHVQLRRLFEVAYPNQDPETSSHLMGNFKRSLYYASARSQMLVLTGNSDKTLTYTDLLQKAQTIITGIEHERSTADGGGLKGHAKSHGGVNAFGNSSRQNSSSNDRRHKGLQCYYCGKFNHIAQECRKKQADAKQGVNNPKGKSSGGGQGKSSQNKENRSRSRSAHGRTKKQSQGSGQGQGYFVANLKNEPAGGDDEEYSSDHAGYDKDSENC